MLTKKVFFFPLELCTATGISRVPQWEACLLGRKDATGNVMWRGGGSSAFWGQNTLLWPNPCQAKPGAGVRTWWCPELPALLPMDIPAPGPLLPRQIIAKLEALAVCKAACSVSPWGIWPPRLEKSRLYRGEMRMRGKKQSKWFVWFPSSPEGD